MQAKAKFNSGKEALEYIKTNTNKLQSDFEKHVNEQQKEHNNIYQKKKEDTKTCTTCQKTKPESEFYSRGLKCKECLKEDGKQRRIQLKEKEIDDPSKPKTCNYCGEEKEQKDFRKNRRKCIQCERAHGRNYRKNGAGKKKAKEWVENNKERMAELQSNWYGKNKNNINNTYVGRYHDDEHFRIHKLTKSSLCSSVSIALKKTTLDDKYNKHLDCKMGLYKEWLAFTMDFSVMNDLNYGKVWHIDHVIPVDKFDLTNEQDKKDCFHWMNTTPLLSKDNMNKKAKIDINRTSKHLTNLYTFCTIKGITIPESVKKLYAKHLKMTGNPLRLDYHLAMKT